MLCLTPALLNILFLFLQLITSSINCALNDTVSPNRVSTSLQLALVRLELVQHLMELERRHCVEE